MPDFWRNSGFHLLERDAAGRLRITDDFLRLLDDSFGRDWRNPLKWPWARLLWAYGFTVVGATLTAGIGLILWTLLVASRPATAPTVQVETSQSYRLER